MTVTHNSFLMLEIYIHLRFTSK